MGQAITVKFSGASNSTGARIIVRTTSGISKRLPYPHEIHHAKRHAWAAMEMAKSLGWPGFFSVADLDGKGVSVATRSVTGSLAERLVMSLRIMANAGEYPCGYEGEEWFYNAPNDDGAKDTEF